MSYLQWFLEHQKKHQQIIKKLTHLSDDQIIEYFRFDNMVKSEPSFCPLYKENKKCHNMDILNCYLCACPNFRFNDKGIKNMQGKTLYSKCSIDSKDGSQYIIHNAIHQDCSKCNIPHEENYIKKVFSRNWSEIMKYVK